MAKKKNSKALFEVLSKADSTMNVPDWMRPRRVGAAPEESAEATETQAEAGATLPIEQGEAPVPPAPTESEDNLVEVPPPADEADEDYKSEPDDEIDVEVEEAPATEEETEYEDEDADDLPEADETSQETEEVEDAEVYEPVPEAPKPLARFSAWARTVRQKHDAAEEAPSAQFSLNTRAVGLLIAAVAVLLLVAFVLGRVTASRTPPKLAPSQPPSPAANTPQLRPVVMDDKPITCESGRRDPDRYFLIIETLKGNGDADKAEADRIIEFCKARELPADAVVLQSGRKQRVAVWCLLGFRFRHSKAALDHARKVEQVGQAYFAKNKTYQFLQRRRKDGPLGPFFYPGRVEQPSQ